MIPDLRNSYIKQPSEQIPIEVNFGSLSILPRGAKEIISTNAISKRRKRSNPDIVEPAPEFLVSATPTILTPTRCKIRFYVMGGQDGYDYQVTVQATFDTGAQLEEEIHVRVVER